MVFRISDIIVSRDDWKVYEINMIYENGTGDYIEIKPVDMQDPRIEDLQLTNHERIEMIKQRGITYSATSECIGMFDHDDRAFRESLPKSRTWNPIVLLRTWLAKRKLK